MGPPARYLRTFPLSDDVNVLADYPIAVLKNAAHADLAQAFVDEVMSDEGQKILARYGFLGGDPRK
jgi:molybdate transport system substrate-binding protein